MPTKIIHVLSCKGCPYSNVFRTVLDGKSVEGICCSKLQNSKVAADSIDERCPLTDTDDFIEGG